MTDSQTPNRPDGRRDDQLYVGAPTTPSERMAQRAVRALPVRPSPEGFRDRLRGEFVSGSISASRAARAPGRRPGRWVALVAAVALVAVLWGLRPSSPPWMVLAAEGAVTFDGAECPSDCAEAARLIHPGTRVEVPEGGNLELVCPGMFALQVDPGSRLTVPGMPSRWNDGTMVVRLDRGVLRITTGPKFAGTTLQIHAPEANVELLGTTLTVLCSEEKTCISVLEGQAELTHADGTRDIVPAGTCHTLYHSGPGSPGAKTVDLPSRERDKLMDLRERGGAVLAL